MTFYRPGQMMLYGVGTGALFEKSGRYYEDQRSDTNAVRVCRIILAIGEGAFLKVRFVG